MHPSVTDVFSRLFHDKPTHLIQAPGRVNLIGEHTDYNDGFVLPCAIDFQTMIAARTRQDRRIRVCAVDYDEAIDEFDIHTPIQKNKNADWANYVRGVVSELLARGTAIGGADLVISGNVPQGAGLSSSASLEVAVAHVFKTLYSLNHLSPTDLALIGQSAENNFVGCNCGIMDQLISATGQKGHAALIDCRTLDVRPVPIPNETAILIIHSRVRRGLVDSEYNTRRQQCDMAAKHYGVKALRDLSPERLLHDAADLDPVTFQRARHVVTENARTQEAAIALQRHDLVRMGELMAQSHQSMRDDFEITVPAIDKLVDIVQHHIGREGGVRMTGGGFGGCVVALVPTERIHAVRDAVMAQYRSPEGELAHIYVCQPSYGARALT